MKEKKKISASIETHSVYPLLEVHKETKGYAQEILKLASSLEQTRHSVESLKDEVNSELKQAEHAERM